MATWSNTPIATLRVRKTDSADDTFSFVGVNSQNEAGSPDQFLAAVNRILVIANKSAQLTGMQRTIKQEVSS